MSSNESAILDPTGQPANPYLQVAGMADALQLAKANPWYPLPRDYDTLTTDGRRLARIAVCRRQRTPLELVTAWTFFVGYYLWPDAAGFFKRKREPARLHYAMVHDLAMYPRSIVAAPRSAAKTTVITKAIPLLFAYTRPKFSVMTVMAKDKFIGLLMDDIKVQIEENPILNADFGSLKPTRGTGMWSSHAIRLPNHFKMVGMPIVGHNRGSRPDLLILDDVEFDPESDTAGPRLTEKLESKMFRVYRPMMDDGTVMYMVGTVVRNNSFLYRAVCSKDPRMDQWNRRLLGVRSDEGQLLWKEKWDHTSIQELQEGMGLDFAREYLNRPVSDQGTVFRFNEQYHTYSLSGVDDKWAMNPTESDLTIHYDTRPHPDSTDRYPVAVPAKELVGNTFRFLTVDVAYKLHKHADFSCICCMSLDHESRLWVWDLQLFRASREQLIERILRMAIKWKVKIIAPEAVSVQQELVDLIQRDTDRLFANALGSIPYVYPIKYKLGASKGDRISSLEWRFSRDRIMLPREALLHNPWRELLYQIVNFTGDPESLAHDDAIDALAMSNEVLANRKVPTPHKAEPASRMEQLLERRRETGISPVSGLNASQLTTADLDLLRKRSTDDQPIGKYRRTFAEDSAILDPMVEFERTGLVNPWSR